MNYKGSRSASREDGGGGFLKTKSKGEEPGGHRWEEAAGGAFEVCSRCWHCRFTIAAKPADVQRGARPTHFEYSADGSGGRTVHEPPCAEPISALFEAVGA